MRQIIGAVAAVITLACSSHANFEVTPAPTKVVGEKAIIALALRNNLPDDIEQARAVIFLTNPEGKVEAQGSRWIIGGDPRNAILPAGETNLFHFVVTSEKRFSTTNLTAKISFVRILLVGGKTADPIKSVTILPPR